MSGTSHRRAGIEGANCDGFVRPSLQNDDKIIVKLSGHRPAQNFSVAKFRPDYS
jgi:hypothetical protein